jgi:hypothetical protein
MPPAVIFQIHLVLGYVPWLLYVNGCQEPRKGGGKR